MKYLLVLAIALLMTAEASAVPFFMVSGGSNGTADRSSIGIEVGGTRAIMDKFPLSAEISMDFNFDEVPSDTRFNSNTLNEPYSTRNVKDGPEIGYLLKSGWNLEQVVKNLTLQLGAGYALQSEISVATGTTTGKHWQQGDDRTEVYLLGYGGLLYRLENLCFNVGYHNRRGVVVGIGSSW
jgi:hypothetical protein